MGKEGCGCPSILVGIVNFMGNFFLWKKQQLLAAFSFYSTNWASEARPTLECSIEISRDICMCVTVGMSVVGQNA